MPSGIASDPLPKRTLINNTTSHHNTQRISFHFTAPLQQYLLCCCHITSRYSSAILRHSASRQIASRQMTSRPIGVSSCTAQRGTGPRRRNGKWYRVQYRCNKGFVFSLFLQLPEDSRKPRELTTTTCILYGEFIDLV